MRMRKKSNGPYSLSQGQLTPERFILARYRKRI